MGPISTMTFNDLAHVGILFHILQQLSTWLSQSDCRVELSILHSLFLQGWSSFPQRCNVSNVHYGGMLLQDTALLHH